MPDYRHLQQFTNSCGATALMCAAAELGVTKLPKHGKWAFMQPQTQLKGNTSAVSEALLSWDGTDFQTAFVSPVVEKALYAVTSGDLDSYSLPSRVVACARLLGLKSTVYVPSGMLKSVLTWKYPNERESCENQEGVTVVDTESPGPTNNQRELQIVTTWVVGLHYVLRRPGTFANAYMDPGDGQNYASYKAMNGMTKAYSDTGISILLEAE